MNLEQALASEGLTLTNGYMRLSTLLQMGGKPVLYGNFGKRLTCWELSMQDGEVQIAQTDRDPRDTISFAVMQSLESKPHAKLLAFLEANQIKIVDGNRRLQMLFESGGKQLLVDYQYQDGPEFERAWELTVAEGEFSLEGASWDPADPAQKPLLVKVLEKAAVVDLNAISTSPHNKRTARPVDDAPSP